MSPCFYKPPNPAPSDCVNFILRQCATLLCYFQCDPRYNTTIGENDAKIANAPSTYSLSVFIEQEYTAAQHLTSPILANTTPKVTLHLCSGPRVANLYPNLHCRWYALAEAGRLESVAAPAAGASYVLTCDRRRV
jgi:hypothetical protein